jgi:hypothetical protein
MAFQKKTTVSYGGRLKNSLRGVKSGVLMLVFGTVLLFLNEGNFVRNDRAIRETGRNLIEVRDISTLDPSLDRRLIHASGFADTQDILTDTLFGVRERAIALNRQVEYFQYRENTRRETRDLMGGGQETITTYTYTQAWVSSPINSSGFEDPNYRNSNFVLMQVASEVTRAANVSFGAYALPPFIISSIYGSEPVTIALSNEQIRQLEERLSRQEGGQMVHVRGNVVYIGQSANSPAIGDVRITLTKTAPANISIIAQVMGNTFDRYLARNGRELSIVSMGIVGSETMISRERSANRVLAWILRIIGIALVIGGLKAMFNILPSLFKVLPFLGKIVGAGVKLVCIVGGGAWSFIVISIAWLFYRPLIAIPMLAVAVGGILFLRARSKGKPVPVVADASSADPAMVSAAGWDCSCGRRGNTGNFCAECGKPQNQ